MIFFCHCSVHFWLISYALPPNLPDNFDSTVSVLCKGNEKGLCIQSKHDSSGHARIKVKIPSIKPLLST